MSNHLHADGPVTGFRQVRGRSGGYADAGFSVTGRYAQTDYEFTMSNAPHALVTESLTSQIADNIYVFANAKDSKGEWAKAEIYVDSPSRYSINKANLVGYFVQQYESQRICGLWQDESDTIILCTWTNKLRIICFLKRRLYERFG
jgi:hypothetical protein